MNTQKQIYQIFQDDSNKIKIQSLNILQPQKDTNHVQRRQQQRAINKIMIQIALLYGRKQYNKGAVIYTLSDRILEKTPYYKFGNTLRGLRVVCRHGLPNPQILTAYWHNKTINRVRG
ncbi:hypothetical protein C7H19_18700 [Aphanothece hegewaldii CCALA 016]|uniref:Uncharacterized protein n=1 Tax=Aphanothece hegewaldii CCALA 016 TaxID=2107694 RepID=A0A2T1LTN7_9CHRO|nr:DUF4258 domain-containing protein [Aphanothece hegewaldii]PSF34460.1 hypothetical protein C7H19_18700 [Aphanothece hegewaldii CCALA 016]